MAGGLKEKVAPGDGATWFVRSADQVRRKRW
jgi:hypothetical protein